MKKKVFVSLLLLVSLFSGCTKDNVKDITAIMVDFFAMDTHCMITYYDENDADAVKLAEDEVNKLELVFSKTDERSVLYKYNNHLDTDIPDNLVDIILFSDEISKSTDGAFNIRLGKLMDTWGFSGTFRIPSKQEIDEAKKDRSVVDLGGVAKGYATDKMVELLKGANVKSAIISLGGNVALIGNKPNGDNYTVGVSYPEPGSTDYLLTMQLSDCFVITSGNYERQFSVDGKSYHHIMDPETGCPADSGLDSVTVVAKNGALGDALSTALFVMGADRGFELYKSGIYDFEAIFVTSDKKILYTDGLEGNIVCRSAEYEIAKR